MGMSWESGCNYHRVVATQKDRGFYQVNSFSVDYDGTYLGAPLQCSR